MPLRFVHGVYCFPVLWLPAPAHVHVINPGHKDMINPVVCRHQYLPESRPYPTSFAMTELSPSSSLEVMGLSHTFIIRSLFVKSLYPGRYDVRDDIHLNTCSALPNPGALTSCSPHGPGLSANAATYLTNTYFRDNLMQGQF